MRDAGSLDRTVTVKMAILDGWIPAPLMDQTECEKKRSVPEKKKKIERKKKRKAGGRKGRQGHSYKSACLQGLRLSLGLLGSQARNSRI